MTDRRCPDGLCDGSGLRQDQASNTAYDCSCRPRLIAARRTSLLSAVIPRLYRDSAWDRLPVTEIDKGIVRTARQFADTIDEQLDAGAGLWLAGPVGTGKTTLAMLISKAALKAGRTAAIYSLPRLLHEIRATFDGDVSHLGLLDSLTGVDLLHLDDVGTEKSSEWVLEELYSIINARYEANRSIVLTTNVERDELVEQIGDRNVSRLAEMCNELLVDGPDLRTRLRTSEVGS